MKTRKTEFSTVTAHSNATNEAPQGPLPDSDPSFAWATDARARYCKHLSDATARMQEDREANIVGRRAPKK